MTKPNNRGFISITLIVIGVLITLKYAFNVDIVGFLTSGKFREFLDTAYTWSAKGWNQYSELLVKLAKMLIDLIKNTLDKFFKN